MAVNQAVKPGPQRRQFQLLRGDVSLMLVKVRPDHAGRDPGQFNPFRLQPGEEAANTPLVGQACVAVAKAAREELVPGEGGCGAEGSYSQRQAIGGVETVRPGRDRNDRKG